MAGFIIIAILSMIYPPIGLAALAVLAAVLVVGIPLRIANEIYETFERRRKGLDD